LAAALNAQRDQSAFPINKIFRSRSGVKSRILTSNAVGETFFTLSRIAARDIPVRAKSLRARHRRSCATSLPDAG
jgi:hypothetical protein